MLRLIRVRCVSYHLYCYSSTTVGTTVVLVYVTLHLISLALLQYNYYSTSTTVISTTVEFVYIVSHITCTVTVQV